MAQFNAAYDLYGERAETALADKLRGLQQLGAALATETDTQALFDEIVKQAAQVTQGSVSSLLLIIQGEQGLEVAAEWGAADGPRPRCLLERQGPIRQALISGKPIISHAPVTLSDGDRQNAANQGKMQVNIPLIYKDQMLGALTVNGVAIEEAHSALNIDLLKTLAGFAAGAVYTERIQQERDDITAALRNMQSHSLALISRQPESKILADAAKVMAGLLETDLIAIFIHDPDTVGLRLCGAHGEMCASLESLADALHPGAITSAYNNGLLFVPNVKTSALLPADVRDQVVADGIVAALSFAVGNEQTAGLGMALAVFKDQPSLLAHQLEAALLYASQISVAIHTLRLGQQAAQTAREQAALFAITQALHSGAEDEVIGRRVLDTLALALRASGGCLLIGDLVDGQKGANGLNGLQLVQTGSPHGQIEYYVALVASGLTDNLDAVVENDDWQALFARLETRFGMAGMLSLWRLTGEGRFTMREQELIQTVSDELARHLENQALIARELEAMRDIAPTTSAAQVSGMAERIAERAMNLAHADGVAIAILDEDNGTYRLEAEFGETPDLRGLESPANFAFLRDLPETQMLFAGRYNQLKGASNELEEEDAALEQHLLLAPLRHDDTQVGVIAFSYSDAVRYRSRLPFIQAMTERAAIGLHNLQLQVDAEQLAMIEERNRIARTMHDGLAQQLAQIRFHTELVRRIMRDDPQRAYDELAEVQQELKKSIGGIRRTINSLEPVLIKKLGLRLALLKLAQDLSEDSSNQIQIDIQMDSSVKSPQAQLAIFRLAQEALSSMMNLHEEGECRCDIFISPNETSITVSHNGQPRVSDVADLVLDQLLAQVKGRNGEVEVENQDGRLVVTAIMRSGSENPPR